MNPFKPFIAALRWLIRVEEEPLTAAERKLLAIVAQGPLRTNGDGLPQFVKEQTCGFCTDEKLCATHMADRLILTAEHVAEHTRDSWAREYIKSRLLEIGAVPKTTDCCAGAECTLCPIEPTEVEITIGECPSGCGKGCCSNHNQEVRR